MHPIQRRVSLTKGISRVLIFMHKKANALNALFFTVPLSLICLSQPVFAQGPPKDRILEAIDASQRRVVQGNVHPLARPEFDQGRLDRSAIIRVTINFKMTADQQSDLNALLASQQDRGSPDYHRWLTPEQFGRRFGLTDSDINKITTWLESAGFRVEGVPASRNMITFTGTAQQVESALGTEMHRYIVNGNPRYANAVEPSVPAALADIVLGFRGLNNFQVKARPLRSGSAKFTSAVSGKHFITPPDFAVIYDVNPIYAHGFTGTGQKIAVVGQSDVALSDVRAFRTNSGLPANDPQPVNPNHPGLVGLIVPGENDPGMTSTDIAEASLDVEWAGAIAYNATVIFIVGDPNAGGVTDAINYAITTSPIPAPIITTSYGACEANIPSSDIKFLQLLMQQANTEGITVLAPAGDSGAADCDNTTSPTNPVTASQFGLAVDIPGALENVTSVGGSEFSEGADTAGVYWNNPPCVALNACSNATVSEDVTPGSALSHIPEGAWNDTDISISGTSTGLAAGGGGSSTVIPKPAWQTGTGIPNDGARDVPDVSLNASPVHDSYLICSENISASASPQFSPTAPTCVNGFRNGPAGTLTAVGGTSVGPPSMAGIVALMNQFTNHSSGSGNINPVLYPLAARNSAAFHDITTGNNMVPFSAACVTSTPIGYSAGAGYDLATGLGSIDAFALITDWSSVTPASTANATSSVDFSLALTPAQLTVKRGSCGTGTLELTPLHGFEGTPSFTCTVPPSLGATTCTVVPSITSSLLYPPGNHLGLEWWEVAGLLLVGVAAGLAFILSRLSVHDAAWTKSWGLIGFWSRAALVSGLAVAIGCGGSSSNTDAAPQVKYSFAVQVPAAAPAGSGAITVNASIGGINHAAQITIITQ